MPRRRSARPKPRREAGGALDFLAASVFGNNPRLPLAAGKAMLRVEPAANTRYYFTRRGEKDAVDGVVGAALIVDDPNDQLEIDDRGRMRLRVLSVDELEAFGWRLVRYAQLLRLVNALGVDWDELRRRYFGSAGDGRGGRGDRGGGSGGGEEEEEAEEAEYEEEEVS